MEVLIILVLCFAYIVDCETFPECHGKPSGTYVADYRKISGCRSFIYCDGENSFQELCSLGLAFNPVKSTCEDRENVFCSDGNDVDIRRRRDINDSPKESQSPSIDFEKRSDIALTKQYPTPPGRTSRTTSRNSNRPVPTRKQSQKPTKLTPSVLSTTRKNTPMTSVVPNRRSTVKPTSRKPKTSVPAKSSTKPSSPINIPTPKGAQNVPVQSKEPALPTLSDETEIETESSRLPTESNSYTSTTKSNPKTKAPKTPTKTKTTTPTKTKTTTTYQTELPTSSTVKSEVASDLKEECIRKTVGNFADPDDCHYYYRCMKGVLNRQECPRGFGWDAKSKMCSTKGCLK